MPLRRLITSAASLVVLALSLYVLAFALWASQQSELEGVLGVLQIAFAAIAATAAAAAVLPTMRGHTRGLRLTMLAIVVDVVWYAFVFTIAEQ